jgi:hypothetical protein
MARLRARGGEVVGRAGLDGEVVGQRGGSGPAGRPPNGGGGSGPTWRPPNGAAVAPPLRRVLLRAGLLRKYDGRRGRWLEPRKKMGYLYPEIFSPGSCHQPGLKTFWWPLQFRAESHTFSPGW